MIGVVVAHVEPILGTLGGNGAYPEVGIHNEWDSIHFKG